MLIKTKLKVPPLRSGMVDRRRLTKTLTAGRKNRLLLITGQAGSGKTSLACQWIHNARLSVVWYSLDESDNEGDLFFRYLLTGLATQHPRLSELFAPLLQGTKRLTIKDVLPPLVDFATAFSEDRYLVLDDYHLITSDEVHDAVSSLLNYLPSNLHLVLISRLEPPFSLSALKVRDQVMQISATDLMFTEKEGEEFLSGTMALNLTAEQMKEFTNRAEGWIGGLQLLGLSFREAERPTDLLKVLDSASKATAQYLIEEVISVQPERVRLLLRDTIFLNRFNADLCRSITGIEETEEILDYLHSINLFLIPLDAEHRWYRYHHLFSEAVRARARSENPRLASQVYRQAALWFAANHYLEDAFQHAFASRNYAFAGDLMEDYLYLLLERYENASVQRWLSKLPYGIFMERPLLRLDECSLKVVSHQLEDVQATITNLENQQAEITGRYDGIKKTRFRNTLAYLKYTLPYHRDPITADIAAMKKGISAIPRDADLSGATIDSTFVWCCLNQGDMKAAEKTLEQGRQGVLASRSIFRKIMWFKALADFERWSGRLARSEAAIEKALSMVDREDLAETPLRFFLYLPLAWLYYLRNDLQKAIEHADMSRRYAEQARYTTEILGDSFLLALLYNAAGRPEEAAPHVATVRSATRTGSPGSIMLHEAFMAYISAVSGDVSSVEKWAEQRQPSADDRFSICLIFECLAYARLLYLQRRFAESCLVLQTIGNKCAERGMLHGVIQAEVLKSASLHAMGNRRQAKTAIEKVIPLAEREGYFRPFVDCWPLAPTLFVDVARDSSSPHLAAVLRACGFQDETTPDAHQTIKGLRQALTPRETEILKLIAAGYKKGEIAGRAFVSPDTVKTHTRHIFEKLDAKTKAEAIYRARQSGIID